MPLSSDETVLLAELSLQHKDFVWQLSFLEHHRLLRKFLKFYAKNDRSIVIGTSAIRDFLSGIRGWRGFNLMCEFDTIETVRDFEERADS